MSNDTVIIRLQKDTYGSDFNLESVLRHAVVYKRQCIHIPHVHANTLIPAKQSNTEGYRANRI